MLNPSHWEPAFDGPITSIQAVCDEWLKNPSLCSKTELLGLISEWANDPTNNWEDLNV